MVDSVKGTPKSPAARAALISPSACCMPHSPTGARATGIATFWPSIWLRSNGRTCRRQRAGGSGSCRNPSRSRGRSVRSRTRFRNSRKHPRHALLIERFQVADIGDDGHVPPVFGRVTNCRVSGEGFEDASGTAAKNHHPIGVLADLSRPPARRCHSVCARIAGGGRVRHSQPLTTVAGPFTMLQDPRAMFSPTQRPVKPTLVARPTTTLTFGRVMREVVPPRHVAGVCLRRFTQARAIVPAGCTPARARNALASAKPAP